jgi:hypothetical protein
VDEEIMAVNSKHTGEHLDPVERGEGAPHEMTEAERQARDDVVYRAYSFIIRLGHKRDIRDFQWAERPVAWVKDETGDIWTCDVSPNRARVMLEEGSCYWDVCVERRAKSDYRLFLQLEEAVVWAEEQLAGAAAGGQAEPGVPPSPAPAACRPTVDLGPYRIDPRALEPGRVTYRVIVELDAAPEHFKTTDLSARRPIRYDERYPSPGRLSAELQIDQAEYGLEQPTGPNDGWNLGHSTVTYYRESVAVEQAQLMWSSSRIVEHYRKGKLLRARYGVEEIETGYVSWLGGCDSSEMPWGKSLTRAEYLAARAQEMTLANALDIDGFRELMGCSLGAVSDERILWSLHRRRADCPAIPAASRAESRRWLSEHRDWRA